MTRNLIFILLMCYFLFAQPLSVLAEVEPEEEFITFETTPVGGMGFFFYESPFGKEDGAAYLLRGAQSYLWLTENAIWLTQWEEQPLQQKGEWQVDQTLRGVHLKISFPGANGQVRLLPEKPMPGHVSLLLGQNPESWTTDLPLWGQLRYREIYSGVDLIVSSTEDGFAWQYEVQNDADLSALRLWVQGANEVKQDDTGTILQTALGEIRLPLLSLEAPGGVIKDLHSTTSQNIPGLIEIYPEIVETKPQELDPDVKLTFSTFLGGSTRDDVADVAVDEQSNAYLAGSTISPDFPITPGVFDETLNLQDSFVAKIDMSGVTPVLAYATYIGGSGTEKAYSLVVENNVAYVTGETDSPDFPLAGEADDVDAFVVKLNATGNDLIYAKLIGGSEPINDADDYGYAIAIDNGTTYLTGITWSTNFPVTNSSSYQGSGDVFIIKLDNDGNTEYATLKGGRDTDVGFDLDVSNGIAWVTGQTWSRNFGPTFAGETDIFVISLSPIGLVTSTRMFGGSSADTGLALILDSSGDIFVTGSTASINFPVTNSSTYGGGLFDAFMFKLTSTSTVFSTYLGGDASEQGYDISIDVSGGVVVAGYTYSNNFPVTDNAYQTMYGGSGDAFITRFFLEGDDPSYRSYSSYLGGSGLDEARGIVMDNSVFTYLVGLTKSADFPTTEDGLFRSLHGIQDGFFSVMAVAPLPTIEIKKFTNGQDADTPPGEYLIPGTTINWTYIVTNTGETTLNNVSVSDNREISVNCPKTSLDAGEQMTCTSPTGVAISGQYGNLGLVMADTPYNTTISDVDSSHYFGAVPATNLVKLINTTDTTTTPGIFLEESSAITWTYEITNTGNVDLSNVRVVDDNGTPDNMGDDITICTIPLLQAGEVDNTSCLMTGTAQSGQYSNIAVVTGTAPGDLGDVFDEDTSHYFGSAAAITLQKLVNGIHVIESSGPYLLVGAPITWTYNITNTGNVTLTNVTVFDNNGTPDDTMDDRTACIGLELSPSATSTCTLTDTVKIGQYHNIALVTGTPPVGSLAPIEDHSYYFGSQPVVDLEFMVNGESADSPPGLHVLADSSLTLDYKVTNTGNVTLTNLIVTDDSGQVCIIPNLGIDANDTCSRTITALSGQQSNVANVTAIPPNPLSNVTANDPVYYFGSTPSLALDKKTNGQDAASMPGIYVLTGSTLDWTYHLTNTGNVTLSDVTVVDDNGTASDSNDDNIPIGCDHITLIPGQDVICTLSGTAHDGQYTNIASVSGNPPSPLIPVNDTDSSNYFGTTLNVRLVKQTNGLDAEDIPGPLIGVGDPVAWTYTVTNNSNVPVDIGVVDDQGLTINCPKSSLAINESVLCTAFGISVAGQYTNSATVTATPPGGLFPIEAQDISHYYGVITGIDIEKFTNDQDADTPIGPLIRVGETVNWTYKIENTGNVRLTAISITDDQGVIVSCPESSLDPGEIMTCTASDTAVKGQYTNLATVTADPPSGFNQVSDTDPSHYFGCDPEVDIQKLTNGVDVDSVPGPYILVGQAVTWTYVITNVGNITVENIIVTDNKPGVVVNCPITILEPGASTVCSAIGLAVSGQYTNIGTVEASLQGLEGFVQDSDTSYYFGADPSIKIIKKINGLDANEAPGPYIPVDEIITNTYEIRNDETLYAFTDIVVSDESGSTPECPQTYLNAGDSMTCTATIPASNGQQAGVAQVEASAWFDQQLPVFLGEITSYDIGYYFGYTLHLALSKYTNGIAVISPPGPELGIGNEVIWTYEVSNESNVPLSDVVVLDDDAGVEVVCPNDKLESDEQMICYANGEVIEGQYTNTSAAYGQFNGEMVEAQDISYYYGIPFVRIYLPIIIH